MGLLVGFGDFGSGTARAYVASMLGINTTLTKAQLRTAEMDGNEVVFISDIGSGSAAIYLPDDTESEDDGETILIDATGKRYKVAPLKEIILNSPYA